MDKAPPKKATWLLYLILMPFLIAGLGNASSVVSTLYQSSKADKWQEAKAIVLSAKLGSKRGDSAVTYRAEGQYTYTWQGKNYQSTRIFIDESHDDDKEYHRDIIRELNKHRNHNNKITIWVNPDNPSDAVIYRTVRPALIIESSIATLIFLSLGALVFWGVSRVGKISKYEAERRRQYPDQPWEWKKIWQSNELKSGHKTQLIVMIIATIVMTIISALAGPKIIALYMEEQDKTLLFFAIFPFCNLICWVQTVIYYLRWKRFAKTAFKVDTFPAALGHILRGELVMQEKLPTGTVFEIKLSNIRRHVVRSNNKSRTVETILWQDEQKIPVETGAYSTAFRLPVLFNIPSDASPSNWEKSDDEFLWRLHAQASIPGADYRQGFELPVFDPSKYNINTQSVTDQVYANKTYTDEGDWTLTDAVATTTAQGQSYYFPPARHKGMAFWLTVVAAMMYTIAIAGPIWLSDQGHIIPTIGSVMCAVVGGVFSLVFTLISLDAWLFRSTLYTSRGQLRVRSGMFRMRDRTYQAKRIKQLTLKSTTRMGNSLHYSINAILHSGTSIKLAVSLAGKRNVAALMEKISEEVGIESPKVR